MEYDITNILISGSDAYILAGEYSEFTATLVFFSYLCSEKPRKKKQDYLNAFKNVKTSYKTLFTGRTIADIASYWIDPLFAEIANNLSKKNIKDIDFEKLHKLTQDVLSDVLSPQTNSFRHMYLQSAISSHAREFYTDELFDVINTPLKNEDYDAAVLAAFKYLDSILQRLVEVDPYLYHGEDLINKAFSLDSGILQMNTHPNEQVGLRNWFSGVNAVFRNAIAHRFVNIDEKSAQSIISMIALMAQIATELSDQNG